MMLSKADFEDLLPDVFPTSSAEDPNAACIARWEDDGGQPERSPHTARAESADAAHWPPIGWAASAMAVAALGQSLAGPRRVVR
ncbi:hypothetical protein [Thalassorhabdomicrobium marinisediminis]|uniref:Uncharacterized protein n=1 Tax=Thalassorhabdomicrobium marinisediminis TaxID=2170577 RepID=A0A2T7G1G3_9RHOB|nr:hypothetical protein [Thalassorhabdomicrobium marinisediminis]PVA08247.1 hypothetical protein DC363_01775 [Thalassorhabdomicrobium marinisediminis]